MKRCSQHRGGFPLTLFLWLAFKIHARADVIAWGGNEYGQTNVPPNATNVVAVSGGFATAQALTMAGTSIVWGDGSFYEYNIPSDATNLVAIGSGMFDHVALKADGTPVQWGNVSYKQFYGFPPVATNIISISTLRAHTLGLLSDGTVIAWGNNDSGQATVPAGLSNVIAVAAGGDHSLALKSDGTVVAWGDNSSGQCNVPAGLTNVIAISAGWSDSVALKSDGTVTAWSDNTIGNSPCVTNIVAISAGLALRPDGTLADWSGTCGAVNDLSNIMSIATGYNLGLAITGVQSPNIYQQPVGLTVLAEGTALFKASAIGSVPLTYQWKLNGTNVPGATASTLLLTNIQLEQAGSYSIAISNRLGGMVSSNAVLSVLAEIVVSQPTNQTVYGGDDATLAVAAQGASLNYQWRHSLTNLDGQTNAQLTIHAATTNDAGIYSAVVSNSYGALESSNAVLTVTPLTITAQPTNRSLYVGDSTTFSVAVQKNGPFAYQWRLGGVDLPDETNSTLTLTNLAASNTGDYSVFVSNPYGSLTSSNAHLAVANSKPIVLTQPAPNGVRLGGSVSFSVVADGTKPLDYQWYFNGTLIPGATNTTLTLSNLVFSNIGNYSVLLNNPVGFTWSSNALLSVLNVITWGSTNSYGLHLVPWELTNAVAIACGVSHSAALKPNGKVVVWGDNYWGQTNMPASVSNVMAIAAALNHTVALRSNGTVVAWGTGGTNVPAGLTNVVAIAAGDYFSLALKTNGTVVAWGDGGYIGDATNVPITLTNAVAIAAGGSFSVAVKSDRSVIAWGSSTPSTNGMTNVVAISGGEFPLVALRANGTVISTAIVSPTFSNAVAVAGGRYHALALKSDGTVTNWSGIGPVTPPGLSNFVAIATRESHCLAILGDGPHATNFPTLNAGWSSNAFSVSVSSLYGKVYWLDYKNSLDETNWKALPMSAGTGSILSLTNSPATNVSRFYRVRQW